MTGHDRGVQPDASHPFQHLVRDADARDGAVPGPDARPGAAAALLDALAGIEETVLIYPSTGGRPKARRLTTELTGDQQKLCEIFDIARWTPRS
jgi:hypothetical protein